MAHIWCAFFFCKDAEIIRIDIVWDPSRDLDEIGGGGQWLRPSREIEIGVVVIALASVADPDGGARAKGKEDPRH